jgi:hypothetical protein
LLSSSLVGIEPPTDRINRGLRLCRRGRHFIDCPLAPDVTGWLFYPHDGELENGGIYVNPDDQSCILLLVKGCPVRADAEKSDAA